jgi:hypothetical protein
MSAAGYEIALGAAEPGRLSRFLTWLAETMDSHVASRSRNAVLDRDLQQARQDMDRVARLLDAGHPLYRADLSTEPTAQGRKVYY